MCGIVAGVAERNIVPILLEGLRRLEYRGYDSAGVAVLDATNELARVRVQGKIAQLESALEAQPLAGRVGISHTRWATHGVPSVDNAHPHRSGDIAIVHNGIFENHSELRAELQGKGCVFSSETDTEVIAHLIADYYAQRGDLRWAVQQAVERVKGSYSLVVMSRKEPQRLVGVRAGAPLLLGVGIGELFLASDSYALMPVTHRFVYLQDGDLVDIQADHYQVFDRVQQPVQRMLEESTQDGDVMDKGPYRHFMQKEIYEQPDVVAQTLEGRIQAETWNSAGFSATLKAKLANCQHLHIVACGSSYLAGLLAKYGFERHNIAVSVEVASEYRYRQQAVPANTLLVVISQSGETADTLAALNNAKKQPYLGYVAICNVMDSSIVRAADEVLLTRAGREIGVASTKALLAQLTTLKILEILILESQGQVPKASTLVALEALPRELTEALALDKAVAELAKPLANAKSILYLGRRELYPVALEGALKLKELSYIHAEAYPAGELKHGPLALVDETLPVVAILQADELTDKVLSNLQEVAARGGRLFVIHDERVTLTGLRCEHSLAIPATHLGNTPLVLIVIMQFLAYHVALARGTDVDQPRNLAKSVTVE